MYFLKKMTHVRLLKNFSDLYAYSFGKLCHSVRLFQTERLLEILEYHRNDLNLSSELNCKRLRQSLC